MFRLPPEKKKEVIKRFCICSITAGNLGQNICHMYHALYIHIRENCHKTVARCIFSGFEKTRNFIVHLIVRVYTHLAGYLRYLPVQPTVNILLSVQQYYMQVCGEVI